MRSLSGLRLAFQNGIPFGKKRQGGLSLVRNYSKDVAFWLDSGNLFCSNRAFGNVYTVLNRKNDPK